MTGILNSAETATVINDSMHDEAVKDSSEASMDDEISCMREMKPGKGVLFVIQNLPVEMYRLQVLSDFISNEMSWNYSFSVWDERHLVVMLRFGCIQKLRNMETNSIFEMD